MHSILNWISALSALVSMLYVNVFYIPNFVPMFNALGGKLPLITVIGLTISAFIATNAFILLAALIALAALAHFRLSEDRKKYIAPVLTILSCGLICVALAAIINPIIALQKALR